MSAQRNPVPWLQYLGWLVALGGFALALLGYERARQADQAARVGIPIYRLDFDTFDPDSLPKAVAEIKEPVKHRFALRCVAGDALRDPEITFWCSDCTIQEVTITSMNTGTVVAVPGPTEATVSREKLLSDQTLEGYVVTIGLVSLHALVEAHDAVSDTVARRASAEWDWGQISAGTIALGAVGLALLGGLVFVIFRAARALRGGAGVDSQRANPWLIVLLILAVLADLALRDGNAVMDALAAAFLYFLLTRWRVASLALTLFVRLRTKDVIAEASERAKSEEPPRVAATVPLPAGGGAGETA
jgi:hypothetical protein